MQIHDYSTRRGVIVPLLPKIYAMVKELAECDKLSGLEIPEHLISWQHKKRRELIDINRRFLLATDGENLAGIFFYRYDAEKIFLEDVLVAWIFRNNPHVIDGFLKRLEYDKDAKSAIFFAGERIKKEPDKEILSSKGLAKNSDGAEKLGDFSQMSAALKLRFSRA